MKLTSMKLSKTENKAKAEPIATEGPAYPWGLSLTLDDETLTKLGLDVNDFTLTTPVMVHAKATASSLSSNKDKAGKRASVSLQITDLALETAGQKAEETKDALYGKAKA